MNYKTEQEKFWIEKDWANSYMERKSLENISLLPYKNFFSNIIKKEYDIKSIIEFGANIGLNLIALYQLFPDIEYSAVEINKDACNELEKINFITNIYNQSLLNLDINEKSDLVIIKTVLIHINPKYLNLVYQELYETSNKYILIAEYYNPTPIEINYRGHNDKLFKRDFAGELMDKYKDLELIDYGFAYHRDNKTAQDDVTWFLLKKIEKK